MTPQTQRLPRYRCARRADARSVTDVVSIERSWMEAAACPVFRLGSCVGQPHFKFWDSYNEVKQVEKDHRLGYGFFGKLKVTFDFVFFQPRDLLLFRPNNFLHFFDSSHFYNVVEKCQEYLLCTRFPLHRCNNKC